jgi:hypothetical protein
VLGKLRSLQAIWRKLICRSRKVFMCERRKRERGVL